MGTDLVTNFCLYSFPLKRVLSDLQLTFNFSRKGQKAILEMDKLLLCFVLAIAGMAVDEYATNLKIYLTNVTSNASVTFDDFSQVLDDL